MVDNALCLITAGVFAGLTVTIADSEPVQGYIYIVLPCGDLACVHRNKLKPIN